MEPNENNIFYHLTPKKNVENIKRIGLIPSVGVNSKLVGEQKRGIFLSDYNSVPYWYIQLGYHDSGEDVSLLRVKYDGLKMSSRDFNYCNETRIEEKIPPEDIRVAKWNYEKEGLKEYMIELSLSYEASISYSCEFCADFYSSYGNKLKEDLRDYLISALTVIERLDFSTVSDTLWEIRLQDASNSGYTVFTDYYMRHGGLRLWEMLPLYPKDFTYDLRMDLYHKIQSIFSGNIKYLDTEIWGKANWTNWEEKLA